MMFLAVSFDAQAGVAREMVSGEYFHEEDRVDGQDTNERWHFFNEKGLTCYNIVSSMLVQGAS